MPRLSDVIDSEQALKSSMARMMSDECARESPVLNSGFKTIAEVSRWICHKPFPSFDFKKVIEGFNKDGNNE